MNIHNIDLHFHAGQERHSDVGLFAYLDYAQNTGRRIVGITDHFRYFTTEVRSDGPFYDNSIEGMKQFRCEIDSLKKSFPALKLFFAPEIEWRRDFSEVTPEVVEISDYFICEPMFISRGYVGNTDFVVNRLCEISDFSKKTGKAAFLAHPFRHLVNDVLATPFAESEQERDSMGLREIEADVQYRENWQDYTEEEISTFLECDVKKIAKTAAKHDIAIEANGTTQYFARAHNHPIILQTIWGAYRIMQECGVDIVPSSDLHRFKKSNKNVGQSVPYELFDALGIKSKDIKFLQKIM